ncbi:hypothetical protein LPJ73_006233, partial [Coemansia sp. RSA 2703]
MGRTFELLEEQSARQNNKFLPPVADFKTDFAQRTTVESKLPYTEFVGDLNKSESDVR